MLLIWGLYTLTIGAGGQPMHCLSTCEPGVRRGSLYKSLCSDSFLWPKPPWFRCLSEILDHHLALFYSQGEERTSVWIDLILSLYTITTGAQT